MKSFIKDEALSMVIRTSLISLNVKELVNLAFDFMQLFINVGNEP